MEKNLYELARAELVRDSFAKELRTRLADLRRRKIEVMTEISVLEMFDPAQAEIARESLRGDDQRMFDAANRAAPSWWK